MDNSVKITLIIVIGVILLGIVAYALIMTNLPPVNPITTTGQASIKAVPDLVKVYFSIESKAQTAQSARGNASVIYEDLQTALIRLGFLPTDIQTQSMSVDPNQFWNGNTYMTDGYIARQQIVLEFNASQSNKISEVIDAGVSSGAGISYINFELSVKKQNEYKAQAYMQAAQDAQVKAESIVAGAGKKLGKLYSISAQEFNYQPWRMYDSVTSANAPEAKSAVAGIAPSSQDITAQVTVVYRLA